MRQWALSPALRWWLPLVAWWFRSITSGLVFVYLHLNASVLIAWCVLIIYLLYLTYISVDTPELHASNTPYAKSIVERCPSMKEQWRYPIWAAEPNLTTLYSGLVRPPSTIKFTRNLLDTPDGGVTVVDFSESEHFTDSSPIVLIVPGTGGTSHASYVNVAAELFRDAKHWRAAVTAWRGCGTVPLKSPRLSHAGDTEDIALCVEHIRKKYPRAPLMALAFSLGAQVLTKYLGESSDHCPIIGAVSISQGYDNHRALKILLDSSWFYSRAVTKKWTQIIRENTHLFKEKHSEIVDNLHKIQTWEDFDREVTIRMNGFPDVETFYKHINARAWMDKIRCPLLCLNAKDDPLISHSCIDYDLPRENPLITLVVTNVGGHLAWPEGFLWPKPTTWADRVSLQFLSCVMSDWEKRVHPWQQPSATIPFSSSQTNNGKTRETSSATTARPRRGSITRRSSSVNSK